MRFSLVFAISLPLLAAPESIRVSIVKGAPITITTAKAVFEASPAGYIRPSLLTRTGRLTLDDPGAAATGSSVKVDGTRLERFVIDFSGVKTSDASGAFGARGKRIVIPSLAQGPNGEAIERTLVLEVYEDFQEMLMATAIYKNAGKAPVRLERVVEQRRRLNAGLVQPGAPPYQFWSFHGASAGLDETASLTNDFYRANLMGTMSEGKGGGVPVVALWTARLGTAVGHLEPLPLVVNLPVRVGEDEHPEVSLELHPEAVLRPGESYTTPRTFQVVFRGDYYEAFRMYSLALQREGWKLAKPSDAAWEANWCGWGYGPNVNPEQMRGILPKLKEYNIHWATLDDKWFQTYGDWNPRLDNWPGSSVRDMVDFYHRNGIKVTIWWIPIVAEINSTFYRYRRRPGQEVQGMWFNWVDSEVVKQHRDWLILDRGGKPSSFTRNLGALCPALKEVQEYHRELTRKFIRDWGFDGHKLDYSFGVTPCYNPNHHHKSPSESVNAMADIYRIIFETTRELKPDSVTQACPCGTPPNIAWLPYIDQSVTADPSGAPQLRRRVKMYKALLGPNAPVYGDHIELTATKGPGTGKDFASQIGTGAVFGSRFVWPQKEGWDDSRLTPEKEPLWKKWVGIYQVKMLSRGEFRNLYVFGYDKPEGYAIAKDGKMYYAFYAPTPEESFKGEIELRGLEPGRYHVYDYVNDKHLGTVAAGRARLKVEFTGSLLLEVNR